MCISWGGIRIGSDGSDIDIGLGVGIGIAARGLACQGPGCGEQLLVGRSREVLATWSHTHQAQIRSTTVASTRRLVLWNHQQANPGQEDQMAASDRIDSGESRKCMSPSMCVCAPAHARKTAPFPIHHSSCAPTVPARITIPQTSKSFVLAK